jgi:hypothetical protein
MTALQSAMLLPLESQRRFTLLLARVGAPVFSQLRVPMHDIKPMKPPRIAPTAAFTIWSGDLSLAVFRRDYPDEWLENFKEPPAGSGPAAAAAAADSSGDSTAGARRQRRRPPPPPQLLMLHSFRHPQLRTALHFAAMKGGAAGTEWLVALLEARADPCQTDISGKTCLHLAAERLHVQCARAVVSATGRTSLALQRRLLQAEDHGGRTALDLLGESEALVLIGKGLPAHRKRVARCRAASCLRSSAAATAERRWKILQEAQEEQAWAELYHAAHSRSSWRLSDHAGDGDGDALTRTELDAYLANIGFTQPMNNVTWRKISEPDDVASAKDERSVGRAVGLREFRRAMHWFGRAKHLWDDFIRVCEIPGGDGPQRALELTSRYVAAEVAECRQAMSVESSPCSRRLRWLGRRLLLGCCIPPTFVWGVGLVAVRPLFSLSIGELTVALEATTHREQGAVILFLLWLCGGCFVLPYLAAATDDIPTRTSYATYFRWHYVTTIMTINLFVVARVLREAAGTIPAMKSSDNTLALARDDDDDDDVSAAPADSESANGAGASSSLTADQRLELRKELEYDARLRRASLEASREQHDQLLQARLHAKKRLATAEPTVPGQIVADSMSAGTIAPTKGSAERRAMVVASQREHEEIQRGVASQQASHRQRLQDRIEQKGGAGLLSAEQVMLTKLPSLRFSRHHGYWRPGREVSSTTGHEGEPIITRVKVWDMETQQYVEVTQTAAQEAGQHRSGGPLAMRQTDAFSMHVPPQHTHVSRRARWNRRNAQFVMLRLWELTQLASLPLTQPSRKKEHEWMAPVIRAVGRVTQTAFIQLPISSSEAQSLLVEFSFILVCGVCVAWVFICG